MFIPASIETRKVPIHIFHFSHLKTFTLCPSTFSVAIHARAV